MKAIVIRLFLIVLVVSCVASYSDQLPQREMREGWNFRLLKRSRDHGTLGVFDFKET
jgi:hypothetical protein